MPVLPPGRKSLTVTPCFKHPLVKAFPWQTALRRSLPSLQCSRTLPSLLHLLHPLSPLGHAAAPAMGNPSCLPGISSSSLIVATPADPSLSPLPGVPQRADSRFPAARASLSPAGRGAGCLPPCLGRSVGAQHTPWPGRRRSELPAGRDSEPWAMFSPAAARREAPLSLPTSLSSAVPGLISAWHLERRSCPAPPAPSGFLLLF